MICRVVLYENKCYKLIVRMLHETIHAKAKEWFGSPDCKIRSVVHYIRQKGQLRQPQIEAIETYLYLKIAGGNKPLWEIITAGYFLNGTDLDRLNLSVPSREILKESLPARSIFELVRKNVGNSTSQLTAAEQSIANAAPNIDFTAAAKRIFYEVEYTDFLMSLPMGAGKTYLMAAIMYLDLYFASNEPENELFAHNFLILIPSGLKTSIIPSLKSIEHFDPTWVIPNPAAKELKRQIKFEVLDEAKSGSKSNKARNPNVQKIARHEPIEDQLGLVMVVNAEKVILDRLELDKQGHLYEKSEDEKDAYANELRSTIGKIPNLQIHIDEVHHATDSDIKLRQVVNKWHEKGNVNSVIGYSGTPYLESREKIPLSDSIIFTSEQITNTVYHFPLIDGVKTFLKKPEIKKADGRLSSLEIIRRGVEEFREKYEKKKYANKAIAKLAIYCGTIERLEDDVYPFLTGELGIKPEEILKFHQNKKGYPVTKEQALEFKLLDEPSSKKRYILLVQIGKEGWDCRSLTGVVLSQSGDCPRNMVLQTSCRCLRQVDPGKHETALVWLSRDNADVLNNELQKKQKTDIAELNRAGETDDKLLVERRSRLEHLKLPSIDFHQMEVRHQILNVETAPEPSKKIAAIDAAEHYDPAIVATQKLAEGDAITKVFVNEIYGGHADYNRWLFQIAKESFDTVTVKRLREFDKQLSKIFKTVTVNSSTFNEAYDLFEINKQIRLAFHTRRQFKISDEVVPDEARMLIVEKLEAIGEPKHRLPNEKDTREILEADASGVSVEERNRRIKEAYEKMAKELEGLAFTPPIPNGLSTIAKSKDRSFHFVPYKFDSGFEKWFLEDVLSFDYIAERGLEVYFNGERHLTEFKIRCYSKGKIPIGEYTPDFLIMERREGKIYRLLIVETKGKVFGNDKRFQEKKTFAETEFLRINNEQAGYNRFDYIYLTDAEKDSRNQRRLFEKVQAFFLD